MLTVASDLGAKVAVLDYVSPSTQGQGRIIPLPPSSKHIHRLFSPLFTRARPTPILLLLLPYSFQDRPGVSAGPVSMSGAYQRSCSTRLVCWDRLSGWVTHQWHRLQWSSSIVTALLIEDTSKNRTLSSVPNTLNTPLKCGHFALQQVGLMSSTVYHCQDETTLF